MSTNNESIDRLRRLTPEQREVWDERVAICVIDGGLTEAEAEAIAWEQIAREFGPPRLAASFPSPTQELPHGH